MLYKMMAARAHLVILLRTARPSGPFVIFLRSFLLPFALRVQSAYRPLTDVTGGEREREIEREREGEKRGGVRKREEKEIYALVLVLLVVGSSAHYPETLSRQRRSAAIDIDSDDDFSFPNIGIVDPYAFHQQMMERHFRNMQSMFGGAGFGQGFSSNNANVHSASSSISLGPDGGFQRAAINPVGPGVESRFAEELPAPSGNNVGVFSSSRSSVVVGPDGKTVAHKSATTGVNDNGRIYSRTVEE